MDAYIYLVSTVLIVFPSLYYQKKKKESKILADSAKLQKIQKKCVFIAILGIALFVLNMIINSLWKI